MPNDRSEAALRERLEIAGKATKGPWYHVLAAIVGTKEIPDDDNATCICFTEWGASGDPQANAAHIAASSPDVVQADIEEILRLRQEVARLELENQRLAVDGINGEAYLLTCLDIIRKAVGMPVGSDWQQVAERVERLSKEADWLAESLEIESPYCYECEFKDERYSEYEENITWCAHAPDGTNDTCDQSWRKAARKAVEESA